MEADTRMSYKRDKYEAILSIFIKLNQVLSTFIDIHRHRWYKLKRIPLFNTYEASASAKERRTYVNDDIRYREYPTKRECERHHKPALSARYACQSE
jgi:hypothetical protein